MCLPQIIFVSSDSEKEEFDEYFADMPWAAVQFDPEVSMHSS